MKLTVNSSLKLWENGISVDGGLGVEFEVDDDSSPEMVKEMMLRKRRFLDKQLILMAQLQGGIDQKRLKSLSMIMDENYADYERIKNERSTILGTDHVEAPDGVQSEPES